MYVCIPDQLSCLKEVFQKTVCMCQKSNVKIVMFGTRSSEVDIVRYSSFWETWDVSQKEAAQRASALKEKNGMTAVAIRSPPAASIKGRGNMEPGVVQVAGFGERLACCKGVRSFKFPVSGQCGGFSG